MKEERQTVREAGRKKERKKSYLAFGHSKLGPQCVFWGFIFTWKGNGLVRLLCLRMHPMLNDALAQNWGRLEVSVFLFLLTSL